MTYIICIKGHISPYLKVSANNSEAPENLIEKVKNMTLAICTMIVRIRILIRTMVMPIRILIRTTVVLISMIRILIRLTGITNILY